MFFPLIVSYFSFSCVPVTLSISFTSSSTVFLCELLWIFVKTMNSTQKNYPLMMNCLSFFDVLCSVSPKLPPTSSNLVLDDVGGLLWSSDTGILPFFTKLFRLPVLWCAVWYLNRREGSWFLLFIKSYTQLALRYHILVRYSIVWCSGLCRIIILFLSK